ncbi:hypothetical protein M9Y10_019600 [Tritrichomonas musculus]|uniref:Uncharacterized protein n=1 Tax=Tritrichomonas musculus TaxID=1915356 RepID=A0ABR2HJ23_9EUKA
MMDPNSIQFNNCSLPVHIILAHGNNKSFDVNEKNNLLKGLKFAKITLPSTITSIEPNSFMDCDNL